jgi:glyoxylase-like metal-dependent hydrolase (beta-lactamase superfamily II)
VTEQALAALGIHRIPVPIPFPQAGGPVNVYAIEAADGLLLFDAGLGTGEAQAALVAGFEDRGLRLEEVRRIVLSHGHVDHFGAARFVQERAGGAPPVHVHAADAGKVSEAGVRFKELVPLYAAHLSRLGVPPEVIEATGRAGEVSTSLSRRLPEIRPLAEGDVFRGRAVTLGALHMPGHTPGLVCLHDRERGLLLAADHLLERVSPNPLIELDRDGRQVHRPLVAYLASMARTRALEVELVLPGHGPAFAGHRGVIDGLLAFYQKRQARIAAHLAGGPRTGWEVTQALFPAARPGEAFLTVSEAVANLEVLEDQGEVVREADGPTWRFRLA